MPTLRDDKLKALRELIGAEAAGTLLSSLKERDQIASAQGVHYKASGEINRNELLDAITDALSDTTEKCTPGTKDGKYMGKKSESKADGEDEMSDEDMAEDDMEDMAEDDMEEEMLLSTADVKAIASEVGKVMASSMADMKSYMKRGKSSDNADMVLSLKEYTEAQNAFSEQMVSTLEELLTRVKALEARGTGHAPSQSSANTTMGQVYGTTPTQHVENWLFGNR